MALDPTKHADWEIAEEAQSHMKTCYELAEELGLECHAGHGLTYGTVGPVAAIPTIVELNIGHFLIGEAIFRGLRDAIGEMRRIMDEARVA